MKKLTALVALALLAIAGTGYAVTCAQDNVPAGTLLVPYFRVGGAGIVGFNDIPDTSGTDTLVAVTNVSNANILIHVTVWNKYSAPVLDFNVPMTPYDVVFWSMRSILNGNLIVNPAFQKYAVSSSSGTSTDPCGQIYTTSTMGYSTYAVQKYERFSAIDLSDKQRAVSVYNTPAFSGTFRQNVWTSLDESGDITQWTSAGALGAGVLDNDNYACGTPAGAAVAGDFSGYVTIDVVNFCTLYFPNDARYYNEEIIATTGWGTYPGPNVLMGDVFYKDQAPGTSTANIGNISGDPALGLEFDVRLEWGMTVPNITFYGRYNGDGDALAGPVVLPPPAFQFRGDGREPLSSRSATYGIRYLQTAAPTALRTWALFWRGDTYPDDSSLIYTGNGSLCPWYLYKSGWDVDFSGGYGFTNKVHAPIVFLWDNDEGVISVNGCPSPCPGASSGFIFLEAERFVLTPNSSIVPSTFLGGWLAITLPGNAYHQAWAGVQHSGLGLAMSVGHSATLLNGQFLCSPNPTTVYTNTTFTGNGAAVQTY